MYIICWGVNKLWTNGEKFPLQFIKLFERIGSVKRIKLFCYAFHVAVLDAYTCIAWLTGWILSNCVCISEIKRQMNHCLVCFHTYGLLLAGKQNQSSWSNPCDSKIHFHVIIKYAHALSLPPSFRFLAVEVWMENTQRLTKSFGKRCLLAELIIRYCFVQCWDPILEDFLRELGLLSTSRTLCGWHYLHYCVVLNDATHESAIVTRVKSP